MTASGTRRGEGTGVGAAQETGSLFGSAFADGETWARAAGRLRWEPRARSLLICALGRLDGSVLGCVWLLSRKSSRGSGLANGVFCLFFFQFSPFQGEHGFYATPSALVERCALLKQGILSFPFFSVFFILVTIRGAILKS